MSDSGFPASHTTTTTTTTGATVTVSRPYFDISYAKTIPGLLKIVEIILCFLTFCLCAALRSSSPGWSAFVTFFGFLIPLILLILFCFHVVDQLQQIPWALAELGFYGVWTLFLLTAAIAMSVYSSTASYYYRGTGGAAAFFCFVCLILYGFDTFLKFKAWRSESSAPPPSNDYRGGPA